MAIRTTVVQCMEDHHAARFSAPNHDGVITVRADGCRISLETFAGSPATGCVTVHRFAHSAFRTHK